MVPSIIFPASLTFHTAVTQQLAAGHAAEGLQVAKTLAQIRGQQLLHQALGLQISLQEVFMDIAEGQTREFANWRAKLSRLGPQKSEWLAIFIAIFQPN